MSTSIGTTTHNTASSARARGFASATTLLSLSVALAAAVSIATVKLPDADADFNAALPAPASLPENSAREFTRGSVAERLFQSSWGNATPDVYARIAMAFDTEPLRDAELRGVECRARLCRVSFDAEADLPVRKLLPVQLAQSFNSIVTVHEGDTSLVYVEVPPRD